MHARTNTDTHTPHTVDETDTGRVCWEQLESRFDVFEEIRAKWGRGERQIL